MRNLLATTALVTLMAGPAIAETTATKNSHGGTAIYTYSIVTVDKAEARGFLASNLMGQTIYTSSSSQGDAESIGEIDDMIVDDQGAIAAVIVGVGGFLGIGDKEVAVDIDRLNFERLGHNQIRVTSAVTKEELENAADYDRPNTATESELNANEIKNRDLAVNERTLDNDRYAESDRERWLQGRTKMDLQAVSAEQLMGAWVYDAEFNNVGEIGDIVLTTDGKIDAAVVDVGGFLGIGEKPVAVGFDNVEIYGDLNGNYSVKTVHSREELDAIKEYDASSYKLERDTMRMSKS